MVHLGFSCSILLWCTTFNLWTFSWTVHFELLFRLKGTEQIHTEGSYFPSIIISVLCLIYYLIISWQLYLISLIHDVLNIIWRSLNSPLPLWYPYWPPSLLFPLTHLNLTSQPSEGRKASQKILLVRATFSSFSLPSHLEIIFFSMLFSSRRQFFHNPATF